METYLGIKDGDTIYIRFRGGLRNEELEKHAAKLTKRDIVAGSHRFDRVTGIARAGGFSWSVIVTGDAAAEYRRAVALDRLRFIVHGGLGHVTVENLELAISVLTPPADQKEV